MKNNSKKKARLLSFLDACPTAFHAAANIAGTLEAAGFAQLHEGDEWKLVAGGKYYVARNHSSVLAFKMPLKPKPCMAARIVATHLDSPALRLKLRGFKAKCGVDMVPIEVYGGPISTTWLDRPLGIAGIVVDGRDMSCSLYDKKNIAVIPNLAMQHFNLDLKNGITYNPQTQLNACIGISRGCGVSESLGISEDAFDDSELNLYDCTPAALVGKEQDLLNAPRLDNMLAAFTALEAIASLPSCKNDLALAFFADNEEIGNTTRQGANSDFLNSTLKRIVLALKGGEEDLCRMLSKSFLVSNDAAHALHPSYTECYDANYAPVLGGGVVFKKNVKHRYASNGCDNAIFREICRRAGVPCQVFTNRADRPCGSTMGPHLSASLGIRGIDIGIAMFAMHSIRETASVEDVLSCCKAMAYFLGNDKPIPEVKM